MEIHLVFFNSTLRSVSIFLRISRAICSIYWTDSYASKPIRTIVDGFFTRKHLVYKNNFLLLRNLSKAKTPVGKLVYQFN